MSIWGAIGGIGGSVVDSILGNDAQEEAIAFQRKAMKHGIRWRVKDAKAAGIHPIYALGAPTFNPSPSMPPPTNFGAAGQDLGRAIDSMSSASQKQQQFANSMTQLQLENMRLQNDNLYLQNAGVAAQISRIKQPGNPPTVMNAGNGERFLIDGQGSAIQATSGLVKDQPLERVVSQPGAGHSEPGAIPDVGWARTPAGGLMPVPSLDVKQRIEDNIFQEAPHALRTLGPALLQHGDAAPPFRPRDGHVWVFSPIDGWVETPATGTPESSYEYLQ